MLRNDYASEAKTVTIIGTGNFGQAFGNRLLKFGFQVNFGSREPNESFIADKFRSNPMVSIHSLNDVWKLADTLVIFAVKPVCYEFVLKEIFDEKHGNFNYIDKIVIDVSNNDKLKLNQLNSKQTNDDVKSNAEVLRDLFGLYSKNNRNTIVKAFNSTSAYTMSCEYADRSGNGFISSIDMILIACDDTVAGSQVMRFANQIGFHGFEVGYLRNARKLENLNDKIFPDWYCPSIISILICLFNALWYFFYSYVSNTKYKQFSDYLDAFALLPYLNRLFGLSSIQLLSYVYLAGLVASFYQLFYGTKNIKFPAYLDQWLKSRKHFGLWAFSYATLHVIISLCILDAGHYSPWYKQLKLLEINLRGNLSSSSSDVFVQNLKLPTMTLHGELNVLTGVLSYLIMCVLAVTSINSISLSLNMSEWVFIHSKGGYLCLAMSLIHVATMFSRFIIERYIRGYSLGHILSRSKLFICVLPLIILIVKFLFSYCKPLSRRIENIRNGTKRNSNTKIANHQYV
jgi:metalloreductase STEAP1